MELGNEPCFILFVKKPILEGDEVSPSLQFFEQMLEGNLSMIRKL